MDIEKQFEEFIKEDKIEEAFWKVIVPDMPPVFVEAGSAAEIKASMRKKLKGEAFKELVIDRVSKGEMIKKYRELAKGKGDGDSDDEKEKEVDEALLSEKKATISKFKDPKVKDLTIKLAKERGLKVKELGGDKIEISGSERYVSQTISPLINKAKIEEQPNLKEKNMKLEDTVKQVLEGKLPPALQKAIDKKKGKKDDSEVKEDDDPDTPGTQGDKAEYQKKRKAVAKKFGVGDCSELEGEEKKACYAALDKAHVADHEEQTKIAELSPELIKRAADKADDEVEKAKAKRDDPNTSITDYGKHVARRKKKLAQRDRLDRAIPKAAEKKRDQGDAQRYYKANGRAPSGWRVKDGRVVREDTQKSFSKMFSHLKSMMKEKKKKMLKGYSQKY